MIEKSIATIVNVLVSPSVKEKSKAHCRDCGVEIDRRNMFCDADRERRLAERKNEELS